MKRKGFTLIELLAVIIILAVIAVITTPIVTKTIENSKKATAIESAGSLIQSAEYYFVLASPKYGKLDVLSDKLNYKGEKPELGEVEIDKQGKSRLYAYINGYCVTKEYGSELYANKTGKENCNWYGTDNYETTEGTTFTLNNQAIKNYLIYGNSTQETRSGKNLLPYPYSWSTMTESGITFTDNGDGTITVNGTATADISFPIINIYNKLKLNDGTYTFSGAPKSGSDTTYKLVYDFYKDAEWITLNTDYGTGSTRIIKDLDYTHLVISIKIMSGTQCNNLTFKPQIELGSSATSYEPYGAMPSPEFPSEIRSTGDLLTSSNCSSYGSDACNNVGKYVIQVKNRGKNLLDVDNFISTFNQYKDAGLETIKTTFDGYDCMKVYGKLSIEGRNVQYLKNQFKDNTQYTFSMSIYDVSSGTNNNFGISSIIEYTDGTSDVFVAGPRNFGEWKTITLTSKANKTVSYIRFSYGTGYAYSYIKDWQIEEGSSATEYESYKEAVTNIYLDEPLRKVGDYADYIDFANNKVIRYIKNIDLSKYAMGLYNYNSLNGIYIINALDETKSRAVGLSNRENKIGKYYDSTGHYMWIGVDNTNVYWVGILDHLGISTVAEFRQYLNSNPANIDYVLDTPTEETIDLPDIKILEGSSTLSINTSVSPSNVKLTTNK